MIDKGCIVGVCLAVALASVGATAANEERVTEGTEPKVSVDGRQLLFQRASGGRHTVGLFDLESRTVVWMHPGPGEACHPAWGPGGSIVYTYSHETNTSFAARTAGAERGYNLLLRGKAGERILTTGRARDYAVSYSPVTKTFYYTSNNFPPKNDRGTAMFDRTGLFALKDVPGAKPQALFIPQTYNSGVVSPSLSPDGSRFVWAYRPSFWAAWCIAFAPADAPKNVTPATPETMAAYAPAWRADGAAVAFTGFAEGDAGWGVWIMDAHTLARRRVCDGRHPCFSPDGRMLYYDRDGFIWRREVER